MVVEAALEKGGSMTWLHPRMPEPLSVPERHMTFAQ